MRFLGRDLYFDMLEVVSVYYYFVDVVLYFRRVCRACVEMYFYVFQVDDGDFFMMFSYVVVFFRVVVGVYFCVRVRLIVQVVDWRSVDGLRDFEDLVETVVVVGRVDRRVVVSERLGSALFRELGPYDDVAFDFVDVDRRLRYGFASVFVKWDREDVFGSHVFVTCSVDDWYYVVDGLQGGDVIFDRFFVDWRQVED